MREKQAARILVIDDNESVRKSLALVLKEEGYVVDVAENGHEAIEKSKVNYHNLVFLCGTTRD